MEESCQTPDRTETHYSSPSPYLEKEILETPIIKITEENGASEPTSTTILLPAKRADRSALVIGLASLFTAILYIIDKIYFIVKDSAENICTLLSLKYIGSASSFSQFQVSLLSFLTAEAGLVLFAGKKIGILSVYRDICLYIMLIVLLVVSAEKIICFIASWH